MKQLLALLLLPFLSFSQQLQAVDFKSATGKITVNPIDKSLAGNVTYDFEVLKPVDTIYIDAHDMVFSNLKTDAANQQFIASGKQLKLIGKLKAGNHQLTFDYTANPRQTLYFTGSQTTNNLEIWTQGQGKYTSFWFPSFDDVNEKVIFSLSVAFDKNYEVISNGVLSDRTEKAGQYIWNYKMHSPMSSYLLMIAIGKYDKKHEIAASGIPLTMYLQPENATKFEPTYRYS